MTRFLTRILLLAALVLTATCDDSTSPPVPATVTVTAPATTLEALGQTLQLSAQVKDKKGRVINGASVTWASGNESVVSVSPTSGLVTAVSPGAASILATADAAQGSVTLVVSQKPATLEKTEGDGQDGTVGKPLSQNPQVRVLDSGGSPIANATVTFGVIEGGGQVAVPVVPSGADGRASVAWTLGTDVSDQQRLQASVDTFSVTFSATPHAGTPSVLEKAGGDEQTGEAFQALPDALTIRVTDQYGNPVPEVDVAWTPGSETSGAVTPGTSNSGEDGTTHTAWTLGPLLGLQVVEASVENLGSVHFSATATAPPVTKVEVGPPDATVEVGEEIQLTGTATTADGDTLQGVPFAWESSNPSMASVDETGLVTGLMPGLATLSATYQGVTGSVELAVTGQPLPTGIRVEAPDSVAPDETFTVRLILNTGELPHAMGAAAMTLAWDPAVLALGDPQDIESDYLWKGVGPASGDQARFVVSVPAGLSGEVIILEVPLEVLGASGSGSELLLTVDQAISALTFMEIGDQLPGFGAQVEVRAP